jgi:cytochrome c553
VHAFSECITCHGNHGVVRPTVAMLSGLPATPCALCHEPAGGSREAVAEPAVEKRHYEETRDTLLAAAAKAGKKGDEQFGRRGKGAELWEKGLQGLQGHKGLQGLQGRERPRDDLVIRGLFLVFVFIG